MSRFYTLAELESRPTLANGQHDELKIQTPDTRIWLSKDGYFPERRIAIERKNAHGMWLHAQTYPADITPEMYVYCNASCSPYADHARCPSCYHGHSHTWAQHFQWICSWEMTKQFGHFHNWTADQEEKLLDFERQWWADNVPFQWQERYRKTPRW